MRQLPADHPFFTVLPTLATRHTYKKGELILRPYEDNKKCFFIISGLVKVYAISNQGDEEVQVILGPCEIFPITWIINYKGFNLTYETLADSEILVAPQQALLDTMQKDAAFSFAFMEAVVERYVVYAARIDNLGYKFARERLAYRLLVLCKRFGEPDKDGVMLLPVFNQQVIGAAINLSRESVNREINRFERLHIIELRKGHIAILDPNALRHEIGSDGENLYFDL